MSSIIAIDGASGSGKSSTAKLLAKKYHLAYLDTGSMYRAITYIVKSEKHNLENNKNTANFCHLLDKLISQRKLTINLNPENFKILYFNKNINNQLRNQNITKLVSHIASIPQIRALLIAWQQSIIAKHNFTNQHSHTKGIIVEGRDIAKVVIPEADIKILLKSNETTRARRRAKELNIKDITSLAKSIDKRDKADLQINNFANPSADTVVVDNTDMSLNQTVDFIAKIINSKLNNLK
ncbi:MAG: (d)CMP kinase [Bifidobacteriaceae bacterium]|jgi:cytidylate kinase|nr:(d)CMP kinase [Bifidobacteriaceae bacterium]